MSTCTAYDRNGDRTMTGYTTTTGNRVSASPGYTYSYDFEGNLSSKTETASGKVTTYSYDHRNRLTGVTQRASSGGAIVAQATYTYDAFDRRIRTETDADGAGSGAAAVTWSVYDGENTYADFNGTGALQTRYLHGPAVDWLLARTSASGTTAWYLTDRLGSVRDIANTSGAVIDHIAYDAYGKVVSESSPANGDRFKFTGREYDPVTGLQYNRARYYDAAIGRWTQEDPIGFAAGDANLYRYVGNGPTNAVDPSGLMIAAPQTARGVRYDEKFGPGDLVIITGNSPVKFQTFEKASQTQCYTLMPRTPKTTQELIDQIRELSNNGQMKFRRIVIIGHAGGANNGPAVSLNNDGKTEVRLTSKDFVTTDPKDPTKITGPSDLSKAITGALEADGVLVIASCGYYHWTNEIDVMESTRTGKDVDLVQQKEQPYREGWRKNAGDIARALGRRLAVGLRDIKPSPTGEFTGYQPHHVVPLMVEIPSDAKVPDICPPR